MENISSQLLGFIFIFMAAMPSAIVAYCFRRLEHRQNKKEEERDKKDEETKLQCQKKDAAREKEMNLLIRATRASISLGEATALALKNGHTNGETEAALTYAQDIKHEQDNFLTEAATSSIF